MILILPGPSLHCAGHGLTAGPVVPVARLVRNGRESTLTSLVCPKYRPSTPLGPMSNETEILPNLLRDESFEIVMRGYNRKQVDDALARTQNQIRDLEARLARALDDVERTRREMA